MLRGVGTVMSAGTIGILIVGFIAWGIYQVVATYIRNNNNGE